MKICPTCGDKWPDRANFCPKDATNLADVEPVPERGGAPPPDDAKAPSASSPASTPDLELDDRRINQEAIHGFSETQWFMVAQEPEELKEEATTDDLMDMQDKYDRDDSIPYEVRAKYTLSRDKKK